MSKHNYRYDMPNKREWTGECIQPFDGERKVYANVLSELKRIKLIRYDLNIVLLLQGCVCMRVPWYIAEWAEALIHKNAHGLQVQANLNITQSQFS